jgi:hypothetical protein
LPDIARHVIGYRLIRETRVHNAFDYVAGNTCEAVDAGEAALVAIDPAQGAVRVLVGRGLHFSTSQLNLSRVSHRNSMNPPSVSLKSGHDKPKSGRV